MSQTISLDEVYETYRMTEKEHFDIRAVTLGINLLPCVSDDFSTLCQRTEKKILATARQFVKRAEKIQSYYGIPIINKRITITPAAVVLSGALTGAADQDRERCVQYAHLLDRCAGEVGVDFLGGFGGFCEKGMTYAEQTVMDSLPAALGETKKVCGFFSLASSKAGINMRAVAKIGGIIRDLGITTAQAIGAAKFVVFANPVSDNPFMAGGFHGLQEADNVINVGISGPGVVRRAVAGAPRDLSLDELAEVIKKTAFKITRAGELIGQELARNLGVRFGSLDVSLAPTTAVGDSVGRILEAMGLERVGTHGSTAALALLTDAVKKGGMMASSHIGGLSGAFIPISEDVGLAEAVRAGTLTIDKLEAMTTVCSVGLDMIAIPGDTKTTTISAIIADEMAIGVMNNKTTAVRLIPVPGKQAGDYVSWGGLLGNAYVLPLHGESSDYFIWRKGQLPAPVTSFRN
ncbi:MAG: PFL family protein [Deltaproteobacteria bacterium]|nr:PFL family protein [Candidatus Anaeroferrophillus wilburensis]MBN2889146.1 PFL family protein [Deltaproteobacteria bacterium]